MPGSPDSQDSQENVVLTILCCFLSKCMFYENPHFFLQWYQRFGVIFNKLRFVKYNLTADIIVKKSGDFKNTAGKCLQCPFVLQKNTNILKSFRLPLFQKQNLIFSQWKRTPKCYLLPKPQKVTF